jgi:hypothetical protein
MFLHWGGPELLGGNLLSAPNAVTWAAGRLDVFGVDGDTTELLHWWWDNGWGGPEALGGRLGHGPSAVSWAPGRLDVFGTNGNTTELLHWWWDNTGGATATNGWGGPEALGGKLSSGPRAVSWASGRLDVFGADAFTSGLLHWWGPF